jgi:hypothetical protein
MIKSQKKLQAPIPKFQDPRSTRQSFLEIRTNDEYPNSKPQISRPSGISVFLPGIWSLKFENLELKNEDPKA